MPNRHKELVKRFWEARASEKAIHEREVTTPDIWQRWLEIELIKQFLGKEDKVLDVGCGNGYTTRQIAPQVSEVVGIDCGEEMIARALRESASEEGAAEYNVTFWVQDVLSLNETTLGMFDTAISERCLINLENWEEQKCALDKIASVIRPGGRLIFVEGCKQGRENLNRARTDVGLEALPPVWHNVDFDENATESYLKRAYTVERKLNLGAYDFVSRVVHPLLVSPDEPKYDSKINEIAAKIALRTQDSSRIGRVLFLVLRRKGEAA